MPSIVLWLRKPFPCPENWKGKLFTSTVVSLLVFFILDTLQPFGISNITEGKMIFLLGYFFIVFMVMMMTAMVLPLVFLEFFNPDKWNIGRYLVHILIDYLSISVLTWFYTLHAGHGIIEVKNFVFFLWMTFVVSLFPVLVVVYFYERILYSRIKKHADSMTIALGKMKAKRNDNNPVNITFTDKHINVTVSTDNFICAVSAGNYADIYFLQSENLHKMVVRITLSRLLELTSKNPTIIRCHKSSVVNLRHFERVGGNARNYYLILKHLDFHIDISRQMRAGVMKLISGIQE